MSLSGAQDYNCTDHVSAWPRWCPAAAIMHPHQRGPSSSIPGCTAPPQILDGARADSCGQNPPTNQGLSAPPLASNGGSSTSEFWSFRTNSFVLQKAQRGQETWPRSHSKAGAQSLRFLVSWSLFPWPKTEFINLPTHPFIHSVITKLPLRQ